MYVVFEWQRYKFWKQFTTTCYLWICKSMLFSNDKDTNFESNSQPLSKYWVNRHCCFRMTKIQILKAIHNFILIYIIIMLVVFEWQRCKFWKQFTTRANEYTVNKRLFSNDKDTNFESNSQHRDSTLWIHCCCFRMTKIQILKAIHNKIDMQSINLIVVFEWQRYKFWKQFTTKLKSYEE